MLELMIVLVLMVGVLAIVWPNMQRPMRRTTLNEAAQKLREAIDEGRYEAMTTGKPIFVQIQQGNHEVRTGSFNNFADAEDSYGSLSSIGSARLADSVTPTHGNGFGSESRMEPNLLKTWRLPDSVVITEVNWTDSTDEEYIDREQGDSSLTSHRVSQNENTDGAFHDGLVESEAYIALGSSSHSDWWLPISATGQSRDASIVLYDTSIRESMTVTYESATGALEIVR